MATTADDERSYEGYRKKIKKVDETSYVIEKSFVPNMLVRDGSCVRFHDRSPRSTWAGLCTDVCRGGVGCGTEGAGQVLREQLPLGAAV